MSTLRYSILIPTLNRPGLLTTVLQSIAQQTRPVSEVVIIDQSDNDASQRVFENWNPPGTRKKYLHRAVKSLILARNAGFDAFEGTDIVAFIDDDAILAPNFAEEILKVFEADRENRYGGGMGVIEGYTFRKRPLEKLFLMPHEGDGTFLRSGAPTYPHWRPELGDTEFLSGGITFWRAEVARKYRYDERLVAYGQGDDVDFSYRVSREYKNFCQPTARCRHDANVGPGRDNSRLHQRYWIQNMYYLSRKNGFPTSAWVRFALGHIVRDILHLKFKRLRGALEAVWNVVRGRIDSVAGYQEFVRTAQIR